MIANPIHLLPSNTYKTLVRLFWFLVLIFSCVVTSRAQTLENQMNSIYEGNYRLGVYHGLASFGYKMNSKDTILNGAFHLSQSNLEALIREGDEHFSFKGTFEDNVPVDFWNFQFGYFESDGQTTVNENHYKLNIDGVLERASGRMNLGRPDGQWIIEAQTLKNSKVIEVIFKSSIDFNRGLPQKSFQIQNEEMTLIGRFLRDGLAHDAWELYSSSQPDPLEIWYFTEGCLSKIETNEGKLNQTLILDSCQRGDLKSMDLNSSYLEGIQLRQKLIAEDQEAWTFPDGMSEILTQNSNYYQRIDQIFSDLGKTTFDPSFRVRAPDFPLTLAEKEQLDSIEIYYESALEISHLFLDNSHLNILKLADEEVLFLLLVLDHVYHDHLAFIKSILEYREEDILEYIPRQALLDKLWSSSHLSDTIKVNYEWESQKVTKSYNTPIDSIDLTQFSGIGAIKRFAKNTHRITEAVKAGLDQKIDAKQRQQELEALEEILYMAITRLDHRVDSLNHDLPDPIQNTLVSIQTSAKDKLSEYSTREDMTAKPGEARDLIKCFYNMDALAHSIAELPGNWEVIQEEYTDDVWNPFVATVMSEELKTRITEGYKEILIPYFLKEIGKNPECPVIPEMTHHLDLLQQRMLEMRKEETTKIERKLRKETDPRVVMNLFGINGHSQELQP